ncbi:hypothetical protein [Streptomyces sp. NBC_01465]|uniref:hypothetical protein n=1 Tax=Streptomyces sp. NBC_01465 TaxID=2903878 RepID=UPI002E31A138|nr:hypothetical protein [Streptomyces sp. NBC_01465]
MRAAIRRGPRSIDGYLEQLGLPTAGAIRVSLGVSSNAADVAAFLASADETYRDRNPDPAGLSPRTGC